MGVLQAENGLDIPQTEPEAFKFFGIDFDSYRRCGTAAGEDLPDALNLRELLHQDGGREIVDLGDIVFV